MVPRLSLTSGVELRSGRVQGEAGFASDCKRFGARGFVSTTAHRRTVSNRLLPAPQALAGALTLRCHALVSSRLREFSILVITCTVSARAVYRGYAIIVSFSPETAIFVNTYTHHKRHANAQARPETNAGRASNAEGWLEAARVSS
jgi:hypothetical protein